MENNPVEQQPVPNYADDTKGDVLVVDLGPFFCNDHIYGFKLDRGPDGLTKFIL